MTASGATVSILNSYGPTISHVVGAQLSKGLGLSGSISEKWKRAFTLSSEPEHPEKCHSRTEFKTSSLSSGCPSNTLAEDTRQFELTSASTLTSPCTRTDRPL